MGSNRIDKINYYLDIAKSVAERSTCLRKKVGCVIVNNDEIILQEATEPKGKTGEIAVSYRRNFYDKKSNYSYTIYMSEKADKSLVLYLKYIGKTFSEKIEIIKIEMKNREESKRIIEVNKNINLFVLNLLFTKKIKLFKINSIIM